MVEYLTLTYYQIDTCACGLRITWGKNVTHGRTNGPGDYRSRMVPNAMCDCIYILFEQFRKSKQIMGLNSKRNTMKVVIYGLVLVGF